MAYELFYWPTIQGRGEFVRLALEQANVEYTDVARLEGRGRGVSAMMELLDGGDLARPSFAPPFLRDGELVIGQTANILRYLGSGTAWHQGTRVAGFGRTRFSSLSWIWSRRRMTP